jgi:hypothetical protein
MKNSSIVLLITGFLLLFLQYAVYKGGDIPFLPFYKGENFETSLAINLGGIIGFNLFGLIGLILILIAFKSKSK